MSDTSPIILGDENRQISELANTTLQEFFDANPTQSLTITNGISATTAFGVPEGVIHIESQGGISSTIALGTFAVNQVLTASTVASTASVSTPEVILSVEDPNYTKTTAVGNPAVFTPEALIQSFADELISEYENTQVQNMPTRQLIFEDVVTGGIASTAQFGNLETSIITNIPSISISTLLSTDHNVISIIRPEEIQSTVEFGLGEGVLIVEQPLISSALDVGNPGVFSPDATILPYRDEQIGEYENTQINQLPQGQLIFEDVETGGISSTLEFGEPSVSKLISNIGNISSTVAFGAPEGVIQIESQQGIVPTTQFGNAEFILQIEEPPLIASTTTFGIPAVSKLISNIGGITSTVSFPAPIFEGSIFRALIYKDGEISGIGSGEAMVIAGGIRLNPSSRITSSAASGSATLPSNPVGFMSVDIDGTEYRIPYYNAD